jgi:hypothetical protein
MRMSGSMSTSSPVKPILVYTDNETVKLDFDNVSMNTVRYSWRYRCYTLFSQNII